jgi:sugar transferase (PEP-CTERM system associated)
MLGSYRIRTPACLVILAGLEAVIFVLSFYLGMTFSWVGFPGTLGEAVAALPQALLFAGVLWLTMFAVGAYHRDYVLKRAEVVVRMIVGFAVSFAVLTALFYTVPALSIWRSIVVVALVAALLGVIVMRAWAPRLLDLGLLKRRLVVIGVGAQAAKIEALEQNGAALGFLCLGYVAAGEEAAEVTAERILTGVNSGVNSGVDSGVNSGVSSLVDSLKAQRVDEVVVAVRDRRRGLPQRALVDCRLAGMSVMDYATFFAEETGQIDLEALQPSWFLYSEGFSGIRSYKPLKRVIDVVAALGMLVLSLPVSLLAAVAILVEGGGPVLHRQVRVGLGGQPFVLWKFRSMGPDAERDGGPQWATPDDPRTTAIGGLLRRTRIDEIPHDEIPQLVNILKGDMSFVGPRPERPHFVTQHADELPFYGDRHALKPGLTGWAQLNYPYGASPQDARKKLQYDLYYVKFCSFVLDMIIILQTARVIIWPHGMR